MLLDFLVLGVGGMCISAYAGSRGGSFVLKGFLQ